MTHAKKYVLLFSVLSFVLLTPVGVQAEELSGGNNPSGEVHNIIEGVINDEARIRELRVDVEFDCYREIPDGQAQLNTRQIAHIIRSGSKFRWSRDSYDARTIGINFKNSETTLVNDGDKLVWLQKPYYEYPHGTQNKAQNPIAKDNVQPMARIGPPDIYAASCNQPILNGTGLMFMDHHGSLGDLLKKGRVRLLEKTKGKSGEIARLEVFPPEQKEGGKVNEEVKYFVDIDLASYKPVRLERYLQLHLGKWDLFTVWRDFAYAPTKEGVLVLQQFFEDSMTNNPKSWIRWKYSNYQITAVRLKVE